MKEYLLETNAGIARWIWGRTETGWLIIWTNHGGVWEPVRGEFLENGELKDPRINGPSGSSYKEVPETEVFVMVL